jgi:hypothetical protein
MPDHTAISPFYHFTIDLVNKFQKDGLLGIHSTIKVSLFRVFVCYMKNSIWGVLRQAVVRDAALNRPYELIITPLNGDD